MKIASQWKLTYDPDGTPLVILDFGQEMTEELRLPWAQLVDSSPRPKAKGMRYFGRSNVSAGFQIGTVKDHASDLLMREWILDLPLLLQSYLGMTSTLQLEILGGTTRRLSECVLQDVDPVPDTEAGTRSSLPEPTRSRMPRAARLLSFTRNLRRETTDPAP